MTVDTLGEALPREMERVREKVLPYYTPAVNGQLAAAMMRQALDDASKAMASRDLVGMICAYETLKGYRV